MLLRMIKKEAQHFSTRIRTSRIRIAASCIAACPRMARAIDGPQLRVDSVAGNQSRDAAGTSACGDPAPVAAGVQPRIKSVQKPLGIGYVNRGIGITMKDDKRPFR